MFEGAEAVGGYRSVAVGPHDCARDADLAPEAVPTTHLHRADELLVRGDRREAEAALRELGWAVARDRDGLLVCRPGAPPERAPDRELPDGTVVRGAVGELRGRLAGARVEPNVVLCSQALRFTIAPKYQGKRPVRPGAGPPPRRWPGVERRAPRDGVRIGVVDTGVVARHPWLPRQAHWLDADLEAPAAGLDGRSDLVIGHGTFILGQILGRAPTARVYVVRQVDTEGVIDDDELATAIRRLVRRAGRLDLLNLSLGGWTPYDEPPIAVTAVLRELYEQGTVIVAAAGNLESDRPFWPAAMPEVVTVAASGRDGRLARWTNHGPWVDAVLPGEDVLSTYFDGLTWVPGREDPTPQRFSGWATWSGTSFAAPQLVGDIAALMAREGVAEAPAAAERVLARGSRREDPKVPDAVWLESENPLAVVEDEEATAV